MTSSTNDKLVIVTSLFTNQWVRLELSRVRDTAPDTSVRYHAMYKVKLAFRAQHLQHHKQP